MLRSKTAYSICMSATTVRPVAASDTARLCANPTNICAQSTIYNLKSIPAERHSQNAQARAFARNENKVCEKSSSRSAKIVHTRSQTRPQIHTCMRGQENVHTGANTQQQRSATSGNGRRLSGTEEHTNHEA